MKKHWIMDYETLSNCFVGVFQHYKTETRKVLVVHKLKNDFPELVKFLLENAANGEWHISFNGLAFDSQIPQYILLDHKRLMGLDAEEMTADLYAKAQAIIERQDGKEFLEYPEKDLLVRQIDLFKLNHWDNPAKKSSLKWIQFSMDWGNLLDMPINHTTYITTPEAKDIVKLIKDMKLKVQSEIQKDQVRVRAKKIDDLQLVIKILKEKDFDFHIEFVNYR